MKHPDVLEKIYEGVRPGRCPSCDGPVPPPLLGKLGRKRKLCGLEECARAYAVAHRAYMREKAAAQ